MAAQHRQEQILDQLRALGRVQVNDLAERFDVTPETIRRDLTAMDRSGVLRKVHGGAVPASSLALPETGVSHREQLHTAAKQAIAQAVLSHLDLAEGGTLLLDAGTTTGALARILPGVPGLTVITNSVLIAARLASRGETTVRILGGPVRGLTQAAVGPEAGGPGSPARGRGRPGGQWRQRPARAVHPGSRRGHRQARHGARCPPGDRPD